MATIRDIAELAAVSRTTVSIVLNNGRGISDPVRSRVLKVARELGYVPNRAAKSVATGRTHTIGVLTLREEPASDNLYAPDSVIDSLPSDIILGIEDGIEASPYRITFESSPGTVVSGLPRIIKNREVDAVIVIGGSYETEFLSMIAHAEIPAVLTGSLYGGEQLGYVFIDTRAGTSRAVRHLVDLGHRRIAFINGSDRSTNSADKLAGYKAALESSDLEFRPELVSTASFTASEGFRAAKTLLTSGAHPTAVVAAFDGIAVGVLRYARATGMRVPTDLSIVGFEDGWIASHAIPALTTIRVPKRQIGRLALRRLLEVLSGEISRSFRFLLEPELIVRESTAEPPA